MGSPTRQPLIVYAAVYLFISLGAFLTVESIGRRLHSDTVEDVVGLGGRLPWTDAPVLNLAAVVGRG